MKNSRWSEERKDPGLLSRTQKSGLGPTKEDVSGGGALNRDALRQRFRDFRYHEAESPRDACGQLWYLCHRWLRPERSSIEQIVEQVILEQFLTILPSEIQGWVSGCNPETCVQAVGLAEDFLLMKREVESEDEMQIHMETEAETSCLADEPLSLIDPLPSPTEVNLPSPEPRRRRDAWSCKETIAFIDIWKAEDIQLALGQQYRNMKLFEWIADRLRERGFERDAEQCRSRAKDLKRGYKEIKCGDLRSGRAPKTAPYFKLLEQFLCLRKGIVCGKVCGAGVVERLDKWCKKLPQNPMASNRIAQEAIFSASEAIESRVLELQNITPSRWASLHGEIQKNPPKEVQGITDDRKYPNKSFSESEDERMVGEEDSSQITNVYLLSEKVPFEPQAADEKEQPLHSSSIDSLWPTGQVQPLATIHLSPDVLTTPESGSKMHPTNLQHAAKCTLRVRRAHFTSQLSSGPDGAKTDILAVLPNHNTEPNPEQPVLSSAASVTVDPDPLLIPSSKDTSGSSPGPPSTPPKQVAKRKKI